MSFNRFDQETRQKITQLLQQFAEILTTLKVEQDGAVVENCRQILQEVAELEAQQYKLTKRQTEVWRLRRCGYSYKQIAEALIITMSTVKQHLRVVHQKQADFY